MEIVSSRKNKNVVFMRSLIRERSERKKSGLFAAEGDHLCGEAAQLCENGGISLFLYTEKASEKYPDTVKKVCSKSKECVCITEELAEYISDTKSSQGLFAACEMKHNSVSAQANKVVILDGVQDPGNVGTIIRTAEALGFDGVIFSGTCADVYSPKVLRASMGSVFRIPFDELSPAEIREKLCGFTLYAAMLDESAEKLGEEKFTVKTAVVIGSEGGGVSAEMASVCDKKLYIPISSAESLNAAVAAAIIIWEISKN